MVFQAAQQLAATLHKVDATLIYGGSVTVLIGEIARERVHLDGVHSVVGVLYPPRLQIQSRARNKTARTMQ